MKFNIVTASDLNLKDFLPPCLESFKKFGYDPIFYNLGGFDFGIDFEAKTGSKPLHKFPKKPFVILDALFKLPENEWVAWIDVDCIMRDSIDSAISDDYDIGVTFRKDHINTGVLFLKNTEQTKIFVKKWADSATEMDGDQRALNQICNITDPNLVGSVVTVNGTKIKVFDSKIYNNFFFVKDQSDAKIIHYKSKYRNLFPFGTEKDSQ
jgi:hypothetical protein